MAVNISRSQRGDLHAGMTDGKYRKARPDTTVAPTSVLTEASRACLHPDMNWGYINGVASHMLAPDGSTCC